MRRTDNPQPRCSRYFSLRSPNAIGRSVCLLLIVICGLAGCDRVGSSRYAQLMQDAENKSAQGDFERAVNLYEAALDDSPRGAEVHYKLALLYDDKLNDPAREGCQAVDKARRNRCANNVVRRFGYHSGGSGTIA